jgi:LysR substrate binding domain
MAIEQLAQATLVLPEARWGEEDPTRRQLAERAQRAGVTIRPRIEVQHANAALELAARGLGGTLVTRALLDALGYGDRLAAVPLDPPLQETFAFIRRRNFRLSPATRALMTSPRIASQSLLASRAKSRNRSHRREQGSPRVAGAPMRGSSSGMGMALLLPFHAPTPYQETNRSSAGLVGKGGKTRSRFPGGG